MFERPSVIDQRQSLWADKLQVGDRCSYGAGDMFVDVPLADAYVMKMILHDWNDDECVRILRNLHRRAAHAGRVFIVEDVIPQGGTPDFASMFDMHMMCCGTTNGEFADHDSTDKWQEVGGGLTNN